MPQKYKKNQTEKFIKRVRSDIASVMRCFNKDVRSISIPSQITTQQLTLGKHSSLAIQKEKR